MSMAGGWFFLTVSEAFQLGDKDFRLPGLGSYMSVAADKGDDWAKLYGVIAMILMIVALDQLLWRPMVVWGQKVHAWEEGGAVKKACSPGFWILYTVLKLFSFSRVCLNPSRSIPPRICRPWINPSPPR